jgi:hypothetical protein
MAVEKEEEAGIIPLADRREDLEIEVQYHTARVLAGKPFRVNKKYSHIEIPEFKPDEKRERLDWEMEEVRRCLNGYDGMSGRFYFFVNHCKIKHKSRGTIRPDFRAWQMHWAATKERVYATPGSGLVMGKRRQVGLSWDISADNIYDCTFRRDFDIGVNSKGEADSKNLFVKHKFIHRNLPPFLRAAVSVDRRDAMIFSTWNKKTGKFSGTGSSIISVAPTPTAHAGNQYRKLVIDEAGEQPELLSMWSNSEDCIIQDAVRVGTPVIFGTLGDISKNGKGLMEMYLKNHLYNLERYPVYGYNGMLVDDLGNDMIEDAVRWIIYERFRKKEGSRIVYEKYLQKYPLQEDDMFLSVAGAGVGNPILLNKRYKQLIEMPPNQVRGWMRAKEGGGQDFYPDPNGKIVIYSRPQQIANGYIASCDPAEEDDVSKSRDNSNMSACIMSRPFGLDPPRIVAEFTDRPAKLADYNQQLAFLLQWYNGTPVLIEMNKGGFRMKDWFELYYPKLLALSPKSAQSATLGFEMRVGIKMSPDRKRQMMGLLDGYIEAYWEHIPSLRFIEECRVFGGDHEDDDFCCAVGWNLVQLQSDKRVATALDAAEKLKPHSAYQVIQSQSALGPQRTLQITVNGTPIGHVKRRIGNPLFDKR